MARATKQLTVERRRLPVSNLEKILYPGTKFTKARVIDYDISVSKDGPQRPRCFKETRRRISVDQMYDDGDRGGC